MINQSELKTLLHYNPYTGIFTWNTRSRSYFITDSTWKMWNTRFAGTIAGTTRVNIKSYKIIQVKRQRYYIHRLAFLFMTGEFPTQQVDHINGDGTDNRWCNIRSVTSRENSKNSRLRSDNTSGCVGVSWFKSRNKWCVRIKHRGVYLSCGYFNNKEDAIRVRKLAEIEYGYHDNHGQVRPL